MSPVQYAYMKKINILYLLCNYCDEKWFVLQVNSIQGNFGAKYANIFFRNDLARSFYILI